MPSTSIILACAVSLLGLTSVSASPLNARAKCSPNFEGAAVSVVNGGNQWGVTTAAVGSNVITTARGSSLAVHFHFEQSGSPATSYIIREIENDPSNQLAAAANSGSVELAYINTNDPNQIWDVVCDTCSTNISGTSGQVATGCHITLAQSGQCVQAGANSGYAMSLASCNGAGSQSFDFWTN